MVDPCRRMTARATRTLRHRVRAKRVAPRKTGKGSICSAERGMPREAPRHTLNVACCTQLNHAHHDVSLLRATSGIWCLPDEPQATNSYKPTPRETQARSSLTQIALLPKTPKITHIFHEEARRTKDDGRISHKEVLTIVATS